MRRVNWTGELLAEIEQLRQEGYSASAVATILGSNLSKSAVIAKWRQLGVRSHVKHGGGSVTIWPPERTALLVKYRNSSGLSVAEIAEKMGLTVLAVKAKLGRLRLPARHRMSAGLVSEQPGQKVVRIEYRTRLPVDSRNLTARLCGDPPAGRSALDQKKQPSQPSMFREAAE